MTPEILSTIFDYAHDGILAFRESGEIIFVNKTGQNLIKDNSFQDKSVSQFFADFNYQKEMFLESGSTRESMLTALDGSLIPVEVRLGVLSYPQEKIYFILFRDITEEKQQQKHLHMSNILLDTVTLSLADFIKNQDRKTVHEIFQSLLRDILTITQGLVGFTAMQIAGRLQVLASLPKQYSSIFEQVINLVKISKFDPLNELTQEAIRTRRAQIGKIKLLDLSSLNALVIPLVSNEKTIGIFFIGSLTYEYKIETMQFLMPALQAMIVIHEAVADREEKIKALQDLKESESKLRVLVQDLKLHEEELIQAKDIALDLNRAKSFFLANMSHEIRTPLNVVTGMAELLGNTSLNDKQTKYVNNIIETSDILIDIVNQILDLSKIEAGELKLEIGEINLYDIIETVMSMFSAKSEAKNLKFELDFDPKLLNTIYLSDGLRIKQILINLIGNSLKFTESGSVKLRVRLQEKQKGKDFVLFEVIDTGIGFNEKTKERLFSPFTQADASTTRKYGGTGLGLTICKKLVSIMQGTIGVESEEGKGSNFYFTIPLEIYNTQS